MFDLQKEANRRGATAPSLGQANMKKRKQPSGTSHANHVGQSSDWGQFFKASDVKSIRELLNRKGNGRARIVGQVNYAELASILVAGSVGRRKKQRKMQWRENAQVESGSRKEDIQALPARPGKVHGGPQQTLKINALKILEDLIREKYKGSNGAPIFENFENPFAVPIQKAPGQDRRGKDGKLIGKNRRFSRLPNWFHSQRSEDYLSLEQFRARVQREPSPWVALHSYIYSVAETWEVYTRSRVETLSHMKAKYVRQACVKLREKFDDLVLLYSGTE